RVHVFVIDAHGQVFEALDADSTVRITWLPWQALPPLPSGTALDPHSRLTTAQATTLWLFGLSLRAEVMAIPFISGTGWGGWQHLGGHVVGDVAAGTLDNGLIELFGHANDGRLMARRQVGPD